MRRLSSDPGRRGSHHHVSDQEYELHVLYLSKSKLKQSIATSTLMAGFALVAMVEAEINPATPTGILIPFAMLTALLIFVHMVSLLIATRLLPELEAIVKQPSINLPSSISRGYSWPVHVVWYLSNIVGIILFLIDLVIVAFVKFYPIDDKSRIHVGTATLAVVVLLSVISLPFIVIFFRSISKKKIQLHEQNLEKARVLLENMNLPRPPGVAVETSSFNASGLYEEQQAVNRFTDTQV